MAIEVDNLSKRYTGHVMAAISAAEVGKYKLLPWIVRIGSSWHVVWVLIW
jgi:hypothetical protein